MPTWVSDWDNLGPSETGTRADAHGSLAGAAEYDSRGELERNLRDNQMDRLLDFWDFYTCRKRPLSFRLMDSTTIELSGAVVDMISTVSADALTFYNKTREEKIQIVKSWQTLYYLSPRYQLEFDYTLEDFFWRTLCNDLFPESGSNGVWRKSEPADFEA